MRKKEAKKERNYHYHYKYINLCVDKRAQYIMFCNNFPDNLKI